MVAHPPTHHGVDKHSSGSSGHRRPGSRGQAHGTPAGPTQHARAPGSAHGGARSSQRPSTSHGERSEKSSSLSKDGHSSQRGQDQQDILNDYQLGDCLGRGAFGSVYRALHWNSGGTVAVKKVKLADLPKNELRVIMLEIDLLKNLHHPNIVKYHGYERTDDNLFIILEYCENGSLHSICKNFGKFPENLVAIYMSQVLHGLLYLHEQGVIHRDIKGANILTTKEGLVKLADFGVATKTAGLSESSVVGTPYWMAPEVIELSGATTASDIWSLGCTVIELLEGKPPYHKLQPMPALFRIVNDDHPPLPEAASPAVRDFLMQCFQKDPNLRVSARKLLKHPWIVNARRADPIAPTKPTKYDEAVKSVQEWNEALKSPNNSSLRRASRPMSSSPTPVRKEHPPQIPVVPGPKSQLSISKSRPAILEPNEDDEDDNWDDDFASSISPSALQLPHLRPHDNFAGKLSSERLKAYATSFDSVSEESNHDDFFDVGTTTRSPTTYEHYDDIETIRPSSYPKRDSEKSCMPNTSSQRQPSQPKTQILRGGQKPVVVPALKRVASFTRPSAAFTENSVEDYSDLVAADDAAFQKKLQVLKERNMEYSPRLFHPSDLTNLPRSAQAGRKSGSLRRFPSGSEDENLISMKRSKSEVEIQKYAEAEEEDFSDVFGNDNAVAVLKGKPQSDSGSERGTLKMVSSKLSGSWLGDDEDEEDPFAQLDDGFDEMDQEQNVARDRYAKLCKHVQDLVADLKCHEPEDVLLEVSEDLLDILLEWPDIKNVIISSHGMLPILEILDLVPRREIILNLLKIVNIIIFENVEIQENLCFVSGIVTITQFAHKKFPVEIRQEAAAFVRQMYQTSTLTLQMFISCGGLNVLVEFLEEDIDDERDFVLIGVNGVWSVFDLQGPTPKNDFCRILSRSSVLYPLSLVLSRVLSEEGEVAELIQERIVGIFMLFSQAETHVKETVADRMVLKRVLKDLQRMHSHNQITMLKFIKNLSMLNTTHEALQNSNAIEVLTDLLGASMKLPHSQFRDISNQVLNIMYNLCRLSKPRQEDAALNGLIPILQTIVRTELPMKEFALPILCDMAHSGKVGRQILWQNKGLHFYISLLGDKYWQVTALDAIFVWLQEETARVELALISGPFHTAIINCFANPDASADAFEKLLEPLQKLLRISPPVAALLAHPDLFTRTAQKLHTKKPVVRLNLLRIIRSICDATEEQGGGAPLIQAYGLFDAIKKLSNSDPAILVRQVASELIKACEGHTTLLSPVSASSAAHARRGSDYPRSHSRPSSVRRQSVQFTPNGLPPPVPALPSGAQAGGHGLLHPPPTPPSSATPGDRRSRTSSFWDNSGLDSSIRSSLLLDTPEAAARLPRPRSSGSRPRTRDGSGGDSAHGASAAAGGFITGGGLHVRPQLPFRPHTRDGSGSSTGTQGSGSGVSMHSYSRSSGGAAFLSPTPTDSSFGARDSSAGSASGSGFARPSSAAGGRIEGGGNLGQKSRLPVQRPSSRLGRVNQAVALRKGEGDVGRVNANANANGVGGGGGGGGRVQVAGSVPASGHGGAAVSGNLNGAPAASQGPLQGSGPSLPGTPTGGRLAVRRRRQTSSGVVGVVGGVRPPVFKRSKDSAENVAAE